MSLQDLPNLLDWPEMVGGTAFGLGYTTVDNAGEGCALIFQAPRTGTIKKIGWRTDTVTTGGAILVSLETLTAGLPSGTDVASTSAEVTVADANDNVFFLTTLGGGGYSATQGEKLAAVIRAKAGFAGNLRINGCNTAGPFPCGSLSNLPYGAENTGAWAAYGRAPCIAICYDDGEGNDIYYTIPNTLPFATLTSNTAFDETDNPDEVGNVFTLPFRARVCGLWVYADLDADCTLKLYGPTTATIAVESDDRRTTAYATHLFYFASPIILEANTTYRVTILPGAGTISVGDITVQAAAMLGQIPGGTAYYWTQRTDGGAWTDTDTRRCMSIGLLIDQIDTAIGGTYPAANKVLDDAGNFGPEGSTAPAFDLAANDAAVNAAHQAADLAFLNTNKDEMIAANESIQAQYGCDAGTAAGGAAGGGLPILGGSVVR